MAAVIADSTTPNGETKERKRDKKRAREEGALDDTERTPKKLKSSSANPTDDNADASSVGKEKKDKRQKEDKAEKRTSKHKDKRDKKEKKEKEEKKQKRKEKEKEEKKQKRKDKEREKEREKEKKRKEREKEREEKRERKHKRRREESRHDGDDLDASSDAAPNVDNVKRDKKHRNDKKRDDFELPEVNGEHSNPGKRKKKEAKGDDTLDDEFSLNDGEKREKSKKHKLEDPAAAVEDADSLIDDTRHKKKSKKDKEIKFKKHAPELAATLAPTSSAASPPADPDAMSIDAPDSDQTASSVHQPPDTPPEIQFPFFMQTVSLYEPLYPIGWAQPVTNAKYQFLEQLHNKYVPTLRGVLLDYKNVTLGPTPGRGRGAADDEEPTTVASHGEFAVGFGWITADVELFVPSRGAWMEGIINLQTEGHIGVVCFGRFNASIEARRLPSSWKWVPTESNETPALDETASVITSDEHGALQQLHGTGSWVDRRGKRIKGKARFRIRNFDAGTSGDMSYLSLEGTMLDLESERKLVKEEARIALARRSGKGKQGAIRNRAPEFSLTRFEAEEEEAAQNQGQEEDDTARASIGPELQEQAEPDGELETHDGEDDAHATLKDFSDEDLPPNGI